MINHLLRIISHSGSWHLFNELMSEFLRYVLVSCQIPGLAAAAACCLKGLFLLLFAYSDTFIGTRFIRYIFYAILWVMKVRGLLVICYLGGLKE